jgi:probable phosphoglycerate mutase
MNEPRVFRQNRFQRPPGASELVLVRHGESEPLVEGTSFPLVDGHGDPALAPDGQHQADLVGARLAGEPIDAIYVTTLRRTVETAAPLAARLGLTPRVEPDLREVHLGEWEGELFRQKVADRDPIVVQMFRQQRWDLIPGAEPAEVFTARVAAGINRIAAAHPDQRVVVVAHGGTIGEALAQATGSRSWAFVGADNGSISRLVVSPDRWVLRAFNDTSHLAGS